jgi:hypothetical protein
MIFVNDRIDHELSNPLLRNVILDPEILHIAKTILGGTPVYFSDSICTISDKSHGYHKDNADQDSASRVPFLLRSKVNEVLFSVHMELMTIISDGI